MIDDESDAIEWNPMAHAVTPPKAKTPLGPPFNPKLLARAKRIALKYTMLVEPSGGGFVGRTLEQPGILGFGDSPEQCAFATVRSQSFEVCTLLERGDQPLRSLAGKKRHLSVRVRLPLTVNLALERMARDRGYRSVSDFVREAALQVAGQADEAKPSRRPRRRGAA